MSDTTSNKSYYNTPEYGNSPSSSVCYAHYFDLAPEEPKPQNITIEQEQSNSNLNNTNASTIEKK